MTDIVISKAAEGFLLSKSASGRSPNTVRNYRKELARFIEIVGDKDLGSNKYRWLCVSYPRSKLARYYGIARASATS